MENAQRIGWMIVTVQPQTFRHRKQGGESTFADLGFTPNKIINKGQVIGRRGEPFLWKEGVMTNLNVLIPPDPGWEVQSATDINDRGEILGTGIVNGETHAFLMTPRPVPEPSPMILLCSGLIGPLGLRRKFKK